MRTVVVVVSVGSNRHWLGMAIRWINVYCHRFGYDLLLCRSPTISDLEPQQFDKFKNYGRCQKLGIGFLFDRYDRVIQVDDTCLISPQTPDIVQLVPEKAIGCYVEGTRWGEGFQSYLDAHKIAYDRSAPLPRGRFYNNGLAVYSRHHAKLFDVSAIPWNTIRADTKFPTQGYMSHKAEELGLVLHDLGQKYNYVGSMIKKLSGLEEAPVYVFHLTGVLKRRERFEYAKRIDRHFRNQLGGSLVRSSDQVVLPSGENA